eukprot:GFUD01021098.1.p1 GENE.GFUD01021098.1~~GFUD01021098.1.p1  ORF type:complete len:621 (-),score=143.18 GFUD01021098.1:73-1935(-)
MADARNSPSLAIHDADLILDRDGPFSSKIPGSGPNPGHSTDQSTDGVTSVPTASRTIQLTSSRKPVAMATTQEISHKTSSSNSASPTPSIKGHHVTILSWMSGRGSSSGQNCSKNSSANFCRICHEGESSGERLISPCRCSGSVGLIHRSCIEKWLTTVNHDTCELCRQKYSISRHPRPFSTWLCEPAVGDDQRNLVGDGVCFLLLTPLCGISAYLCASGAVYYFKDKESEAIGLICLSALLVTIYMAWLLLTIRYHCQVWFKWRSSNQDIRLLDLSGHRSPDQRRVAPGTGTRADQREQFVSSTEVFEDMATDEVIGKAQEVTAICQSTCSSVSSQHPVHKSAATHPTCQATGQNTSHLDMSQAATMADHLYLSTAVLTNPSLQLPMVEQATDQKAAKHDNFFPPLSPHIISQDPQDQSHSKVVHFTTESEIYATLPDSASPIAERENSLGNCSSNQAQTSTNQAQTKFQNQSHKLGIITMNSRAVSAPYLPDLKHFIALRSRQEPISLSCKSKGTFSPNIRSKNATFSSPQEKSVSITSFPAPLMVFPSLQGPVSMSSKSRGTFSPNNRGSNSTSSSHTGSLSNDTNEQTFQTPQTMFWPSSEERYKSRPLPPIPGYL